MEFSPLTFPIGLRPLDLFHWHSPIQIVPLDFSFGTLLFKLPPWTFPFGFVPLLFFYWKFPVGSFPLTFPFRVFSLEFSPLSQCSFWNFPIGFVLLELSVIFSFVRAFFPGMSF